MAEYPEITDLRTLDAKMRAALTNILPSEAAHIAAAKWHSGVENEADLATFIRRAASSIGIDQVVIAAGYPPEAIEGICEMLEGQKVALDAIPDTTEAAPSAKWSYSANYCYDNGSRPQGDPRIDRATIVYAYNPTRYKGGKAPTGSLENCFRDCTSLLDLDRDIDWQYVTSLSHAFDGTTILPTTEIVFNIPLCTNVSYLGGNFCKITFVGARSVSNITQMAFTNIFLREIAGWNLANVISSTSPLPRLAVVEKISFDGLTINAEYGSEIWAGGNLPYHCDATDARAVNYIRSGLVFYKSASAGRASVIANQSLLDGASLLALCYMAYDWTNNPEQLTASQDESANLSFDFTAAQKDTLAAYIALNGWSIDPTTIMSTKGWIY